MKPAYSFLEVIELIENATKEEITVLCDLLKDDKDKYSPFHLRLISKAIFMQVDAMREHGLSDSVIKQKRIEALDR
jgi:hypothetical protein